MRGVEIGLDSKLVAEQSINSSPQNTKVRILVVPGFVSDTYSEIERQYVELCAGADDDVEFIWLVPDISTKHNHFERPELRSKLTEPAWLPPLRAHGISYVIGSISKYNPIANFLLFRRIFRDYPVDAVYTHFGYERFWATFFAKLWGKVTIWNEHWHSLGTCYVKSKRLFYQLFVDEFIAVSDFIARTLPSKSQIQVVRNAIQADMTSALSAAEIIERRRRLGIPASRIVVLMVSAFRENKRYDLAMPVCQQVLSQHDDVVFVFLGEGATRPWVLNQIRELGMEGRVLAPGHVDHVDEYYPIADICMLTSIGEPCALAVVEAMKYAKPLVAFNSGGTPEVIRNGETGLLVAEEDVAAFADRLVELIENDALRQQIGVKALQAVRFQADRRLWVKHLGRVLGDIVRRRQLPGRHVPA